MMGRPSRYKPEYAEQAYRYALLGATDKQMAEFFGVREQTVNNWKKRHKEFFESLKRGKNLADASVAEKLFTRAMGYEYTEKKVEGVADPDQPSKIIGSKVTKTTKHIPADTTAQIFWLKNRRPDEWREKKTIDLENAPQVNIYLPDNGRSE